jgi:phosphoribosylaminoimidazole carboxylase
MRLRPHVFPFNTWKPILYAVYHRPHNSGHYTIEACEISQFEMHLRAVLGLPCPAPRMRAPCALMLNVLGRETMDATKSVLHRALSVPGAQVHWYAKLENRPGRKMAHITITADSVAQLRERAELLGVPESLHKLPAPGPRVGIIMGSDSDLAVMRVAAEVLEEFSVPFELTIVSAHRTPARMYAYAQSAAERGLQVIIAGAGGAAHLPGMVAALTSLPVIGVPVQTSSLGGQDSLLSIVQMPRGVPVATVAIGGAANAGLLAVRMLAAQDKALLSKMDAYLLKQEDEVLRKASKMESGGYKAYSPSL